MKTPAVPPKLDDLLADATVQQHFFDYYVAAQASVMSDPYLPWDKLRHKEPPADMTVEEWWLAVRLARTNAARPLPLLLDKAGTPFSYVLPDEILQAVDQITRSASGRITISEQVTSTSTRDRYLISSLIEEAITSSQLEGAVTSRRVAKEMIQSGRSPRDRSERMILNNYAAMRRIVELHDTPLTPELVCEIHRIVTDGTLDNPDAAGVVQHDDSQRISVWGDGDQLLHRPPPVSELPERLARLCTFANGTVDDAYIPPALRAVAVHFMMGYDHYFEDGNGRTARALFYWVMLREGFWLTEFITISRILKGAPSKYAQSFLLTEDDDGDLTHFFLYQLTVILRAISDLHDYLARKADEISEVQARIKATPGEFNHRQLGLLDHALRNASATYSATSHSRTHRVSDETARQDLRDLTARGLLQQSRVGKRYVWAPVPDLGEILRT
jgi:Fic family protein